jgi:hypothetical protein
MVGTTLALESLSLIKDYLDIASFQAQRAQVSSPALA